MRPQACYTQRPDRKGTESFCFVSTKSKAQQEVTLKDPIERGLKGCNPGGPRKILQGVTLKDPIERGLKARLPGTLNSVLTVTLKDPIERGLDGKIKK